MSISKTSSPTFYDYLFFPIFYQFKKDFPGFLISDYSSQRNFDINICSVCSGACLFPAGMTVFCTKMSFEFQMEKSP